MGKWLGPTAFLLAIVVFGFWGCIEKPPSGGLQFIEIVQESPACPANICQTEYLLVSDGSLLVRTIGGGFEPQINLDVFSLSQSQANAFFSDANRSFSVSFDRLCEGCGGFNLFFWNNSRLIRQNLFNASVADPDFVRLNDFFSKFEDLGPGPGSKQDFYIQFVFQRPDGQFVDYHFFPSGAWIRSEFGFNEGEIVSVRMGKDFEKISQIRELIPKSYADSPINLNCPAGVLYGSLIVHFENQTTHRSFCAGSLKADSLFVRLAEDWK